MGPGSVLQAQSKEKKHTLSPSRWLLAGLLRGSWELLVHPFPFLALPRHVRAEPSQNKSEASGQALAFTIVIPLHDVRRKVYTTEGVRDMLRVFKSWRKQIQLAKVMVDWDLLCMYCIWASNVYIQTLRCTWFCCMCTKNKAYSTEPFAFEMICSRSVGI